MNSHLQTLIHPYPPLQECADPMEKSLKVLTRIYENNGKILTCGNGGSASDSEHVVGELMKGFLKKRPVGTEKRDALIALAGEDGQRIASQLQSCLPAIALTPQGALATAIANDISGDMVFAQQVYGLVQPGDVLLGFSTSGNSANVVNAFHVAKLCGAFTMAFTGRANSRLSQIADATIQVPADTTPHI